MSDWDKEGIIDRFRELVSDPASSFGRTAETLRKEFGVKVSRNACIGKARRLGLDVGGKKPGRPRSQRGHKLGGAAEHNLVRTITAPRIEYPPVIDDEIPIEQRKTIFELNSETCRWPIGEGAGLFFCGATPLPTKPYCGAHCARAYSKSITVSEAERTRRRLHALKIMHHMRIPGEPITTAPTATDEAA